jgi:arylsulfatase
MNNCKSPNIIFIITDQQRYDTINSLGFPYMDTPNLDRLVNEGISFSNTFVTGASCVPSRASLFSGYYPHTTGVVKNVDCWRHSWVEQLADSGYHCVNIGKMHTVPYDAPVGFHERYIVENKDRFIKGRNFFDEWDKAFRIRGLTKPQRLLYRQKEDYQSRLGAFEWEMPEEMHSDIFVGDMAKWWVDRYSKEQPFFLQIGFPGPHPPYDPIPRYAEPYLKKELPLPNVTQEELDGQPKALRALQHHNTVVDHDSVAHNLKPSREGLQRQRAYYLANVTMIDEKVGEILNSLETKGYLENSIVIFTSDHGDCLGDHGHSQKWTMYDIITRVPMIVWAPGRFQGGRTVDDLVQNMDIGPTILEMAGVQVPATFEAQSLLPALEGNNTGGRSYVFCEQGQDHILQETKFMTMVRNQEWKLVHFLEEDEGQLFNLKEDPDEVSNLWGNPQYAEKKEELLGVLCDWLINSNRKTSNWAQDWR